MGVDLNKLYASMDDSWESGLVKGTATGLESFEVAKAGDFDESKHPRDTHGRFGAGTGYSSPGGDELKKYLGFSRGNRKPDGYKFNSVDSFVLAHGHEWENTHGPLPAGVKQAKLGLCYMNAYQLADAQPDKYTYVEGFATASGIPMGHAWTVDNEGKVVDPTWGGRKDAFTANAAYVGVAFPLEKVRETIFARGKYGVIHNPEQHFPLLKDGI